MKLLEKLFKKQPTKREAVRLAEQVIDMHVEQQMDAEEPDTYKLRMVYEHLDRSGAFTHEELKAFDRKIYAVINNITENKFRVWATAHLVGAAELPDPYKANKQAGSGLAAVLGQNAIKGMTPQQYVQEYNQIRNPFEGYSNQCK